MGWIEEKEKMDADRREAHRKYMLTMSELAQAEKDIEILMKRVPELKAQAHKLRCKRDRLDKEFAEKYSDDDVNSKRAQLERLQAQIAKIEKEMRNE